jgi:hypothetical protein
MENGQPKPAIDTNVDVDWGNNLYICDECSGVIGELMGWVRPEDFEKLKAEHKDLERRHEKLRERFKEQKGRLERIISGRKAEKEHKRKRKVKSHE